MAHAKRHYIPEYVWHTPVKQNKKRFNGDNHRCHKREFLLKFLRDRHRWIEWLYQAKKKYSGLSVLNYNEIQNPRKRKGIIDFDRLNNLLGFDNYDDLKDTHSRWVDSEMQNDSRNKENKWTQSIAVGSKTFIEKMKKALGYRTKGRKIISADDTFELRKAVAPFGKADNLDSGNTYLWNQPIDWLRIYRQPASLTGSFCMKINRLSPKYWCFQQSLVYFSLSCCGPTPGLIIC